MDISRILQALLNGLVAAFVVWLLLWLVSMFAPIAINPWPTVVGILVFLISVFSGWSFPARRP